MKALFAAILIVAFTLAPHAPGQTLGSAFTYQGELEQAGVPYTGNADVQFRAYTSASGIVTIGPEITLSDIPCDAGRFTVTLDFLQELPAGAHLEIRVRTPHDPTNAAPYTTLLPRHAFLPTPQATLAARAEIATNSVNAAQFGGNTPSFYQNAANLNAGTLPSARLAGTYASSLSLTNNANIYAGNGSLLSSLNAANIATGVVSPSRGGTGTSITTAATGSVLKWNGTAFIASTDNDTLYSAGPGLSLAGTTFSIPTNGVTGAMIADSTTEAIDLAPDNASLSKISSNFLFTNGTALGIGTTSPTATLHVGTSTPALNIQSTLNGGDAVITLLETAATGGLGAELRYKGIPNLFEIGTIPTAGGPATPAISIARGSSDVSIVGTLSAAAITIPTTTRSVILPPAAFVPSSSSTIYLLDSGGLINNGGSGVQAQFYAPLNLPDGAIITGFSFRCLDNDPTVDISVELHTTTLATGTSTAATVSSSIGSTALRTFSSGTLNLPVDHTLRAHSIKATWAGPLPTPAVIRLIAVRVDYTLTSPLP